MLFNARLFNYMLFNVVYLIIFANSFTSSLIDRRVSSSRRSIHRPLEHTYSLSLLLLPTQIRYILLAVALIPLINGKLMFGSKYLMTMVLFHNSRVEIAIHIVNTTSGSIFKFGNLYMIIIISV